MKPCDKNIKKALELVEEMIVLAELGDADSEDNGCRILYTHLLDSAHEIKQAAEAEKEKHIKKGSWE
jgi:hypothetical protein